LKGGLILVDLIIYDMNNDIGPGDIVGAFINEAGVNSDDIGKIKIDNKKAEVEIADKVAKEVIKTMNNNQIGGISVKVKAKDSEQLLDKKIVEYIDNFSHLVQLERNEEMERHELEMKRLSPYEREKKGRAVLHLRGRDLGTAFGNKPLVKFMRINAGEELPDTEITVGDLAMISKGNPLDKKNPTATVSEKTRYSLTVVFNKKPSSFVYKKGLRLDLYVNDLTFQRMFDALNKLKNVEGRLKELRNKLLGIDKLEWLKKDFIDIDWCNKSLNLSQRQAVKSSLKAKDFYLIQGPPGTGKTMTAIEIIYQSVKKDMNILASADSNIAVDNMVERLSNIGLNVLRVGHPLRVTSVLREHTLDYKVLEHPDYKKAVELRKKADFLLQKQDELTHPGARWRRGMNDKQIKKNADKNRNFRGVPPVKLKEMVEWLNIQEDVDNYFDKINKLEDSACDDLLNKADVVCSTNSTAGSELLANKKFDLLIIDEATQATEPGTLIPLIKSQKTILIGDHKQLPPTVLSNDANEQGLSRSMFERFFEIYGKEFCSLLDIQYRMNNLIMGFSNEKFYNNKLKSDPSVAEHTLKDINIKTPQNKYFTDMAINPEMTVVFLDTSNMEAEERSLSDSNSYDNPVEAEIVLDIIDELIHLGLNPEQMACITPYRDQVDLLNQRNNVDNLEINTVDGFQGREKELIILSLVRSNCNKNIGFLRDLRRLNVAMTRAKRKLILVGDSSTIKSHEFYADLIQYIRKKEDALFYTI